MSDQTFKVHKNSNKQLINKHKHQLDLRTQQYHIELN
jgi:hypothetical protein